MTTTPAQGSRKIYLPVKADTNGIIRDSIGQIVCDTIPEYARQIVTALNGHEVLARIVQRIAKLDTWTLPSDRNVELTEIIVAARKASEVKE